MRYDEHILKLNDFTVAFLSDVCAVITQDLEKTLSFEKMFDIDSEKLIKTKSSVGVSNFYIALKNKIPYLFVNEKKFVLDEILASAKPYETIDLDLPHKFIVYKKGKTVFIALPINNYVYLNRSNVVLKKYLGNMFLFNNLSKDEVIEKCKMLLKYDYNISNLIVDCDEISKDILDVNMTYLNDLSTNNPFYFIDNPHLKVSNTGAKPVLTYGFSRNNSLNYFDVNIHNSFNDFKNIFNYNFNYNKNLFNEKNSMDISAELFCRIVQFNTFLPIMLFEYDRMKNIKEDLYINSLVKYSKLRDRLVPFLFSAYKNKRLYAKEVYKQSQEQLIIDNQLLIVPVVTETEELINQSFININLDDVYYDFQTEERFENGIISDFFAVDKMPFYAKAGSIIPLAISKQSEIEVKVYPGKSNEFILHFDEYVVDEKVRHAYTTFIVEYEENKMLLSINPNAIVEILPSVLHFSFVNIKKNSTVIVNGSKFTVDYNNDKKYMLVDILETNNLVEIEISNIYGIEIERSGEFLDSKLRNYFNKISCSDKELTIYKYKIRPYLHENLDSIISRIDKHVKFISNKHKKNLYKMISMYRK